MRRLPAEWEPQSMVQLTFPHADTDWADMLDEAVACFVQIAEAISRYQNVLVACQDLAPLRPLLAHIPPERLTLAQAPNNDTWARDHGAITVFDDSQPILLDFVFNGWGLKFAADRDNLISRRLHAQGLLRAPMLHGGLALEGGGIETDGQGALLTTEACMLSPNRNPHMDRSALEEAFERLFGVNHILWLQHGHLAGDDTDSHIDTLARFCDPHTIAYVRCDQPDDEHYEDLQAMERELRELRDAKGQPYRLVPLPWPDPCFAADGRRLPATYANFLIINGAVLLPVYRTLQDQTAVDTLKALFPDRDIIPIDCRPLIEQHGSLHCVTMQYYA
ncbi:MAG: agmatine deiminase family protein [Saprospiraceae bacterium]